MCHINSHSGIFCPSTLRSGCVLFITTNQALNSVSLRETIQIDSFIQSEHTTHSGADPAPCQFYNCFLTVIKETIFSSVICEDDCFGLLLSPCLSEDLVWIIFCIKFLWGLQSYTGTCSCDFIAKSFYVTLSVTLFITLSCCGALLTLGIDTKTSQ